MTGPEQHADTVREKYASNRVVTQQTETAWYLLTEDELVALAERVVTLERELRLARSSADRYADAAADSLNKMHAKAEQARAEADRLREALIAMVYVHPCNCGDGIPQGACARCRAVAILGFDPAALAGVTESAGQAAPGPQTKEQTCAA